MTIKDKILVFLMIVSTSLIFSGCLDIRQSAMLKGGIVETDQFRSIDSFNRLDVNGKFNVKLVPSESPYIKVKTGNRSSEVVYSEVKEGVLYVSSLSEASESIIADNHELEIGFDKLNQIKLGGIVDLVAESPLSFDTLVVIANGVSGLDARLKGNALIGNFNGPVVITLEGQVKEAKIMMPGAGTVDAKDLITEIMHFGMQGAGKADVYASEELKVKINGAGIVRYHGQPECVSSNIGGIGRLTKVKLR